MPPSSSAAIPRYGDYLEKVYSRSSVSSDGKFPPTPSKTYINLALVERADEVHDLEELRKNTLHGRINEILKGKRKITADKILKPHKHGKPVSLVFVEGPPGIGKSTLAWELCRRWDRKQYVLAVLLRLREREVQQIENIANLFPHVDQDLQKSVAKDVLDREGKGVLFILDGYDELPVGLRRKGLLLKLVKGEVFPDCSVLVTSRPSATRDLYMACSPQIQRHVEILGFTQECVESYARSIFFSDPKMLNDFLTYISASENPAINSLMYIPLNAAIIVHIFKTSKRKSCPIPKTMTQVYTQLCLTLLQRYLESTDPLNTIVVNDFLGLPGECCSDFTKLSQLAFEQFEQNKIVFYSDCVPEVHFGLLDSIPPLHGGGGVSYNFLHLTVQEFLAAYHITQLPNGIDIFDHCCENKRWEVVWRFVSGLTAFQFFKDSVLSSAFCDTKVVASIDYTPSYSFALSSLFLHCVFEGQVKFDYMSGFGQSAVHCSSLKSSLDIFALGYCIANSSSATSWEVVIDYHSDESLMWGLNSSQNINAIISHLHMENVASIHLYSYPQTILQGIDSLSLSQGSVENAQSLMIAIPLMKNLSALSLSVTDYKSELLDTISHSNITTLKLTAVRLFYSNRLSLQALIKNLTNLTIKLHFAMNFTKDLGNILFGPSSLKQLTFSASLFEKYSFDMLGTNTCLTSVHLEGCINSPFKTFAETLQNNTTMEVLRWDVHFTTYPESIYFDFDQVDLFQAALSCNTTLKEFIMNIDKRYIYGGYDWSRLVSDPRLTITTL